MNIEAPEKEILTLEQVRNQITESEAEVKRLNKLRTNEQYQVDELLKAKHWYTEEIERLKAETAQLQASKTALADELAEAERTIARVPTVKAELKAARSELQTAQQAFETDCQTSSAALQKGADELQEREAALHEAEHTLQQEREAFDAKVARLRGVLAELEN